MTTQSALGGLQPGADRSPDAADMLAHAARSSRYARRLLARDPELIDPADLELRIARIDMAAALDAADTIDEPGLWRALRRLRARTMLHLIARDLAGAAPLSEVTGTMSDLAEVCIGFALGWLDRRLATVHGEPLDADGRRPRLIVVAMGKLGGRELNVSSDIDLVFVHPEGLDTTGPRPLSCHEYFARLGRKLVAALNDITEDGFVFRVDMRLRPYGDSGPLVCSLDTLESYLTVQGRAWERYAWVKGRALTGDRHDELAAIVTPFVYRRHLDFSAIQSMRELHALVRAEVLRRDSIDNIKLGPGGIREIEFTAQVFQLIRGGHDPALRVRPTLGALEVIGERGLMPRPVLAKLMAAYDFLRRLEHRLQYLDDQQTQSLPTGEADRETVAHDMGATDHAALMTALHGHRTIVADAFNSLFAGSPAPAEGEVDPLDMVVLATADDAEATAQIGTLGFADPARALGRIATLRASARFRRMSASGQTRFDRLLPRLLRAAAAGTPPDTTFERLLDIVETIGRRESYLALLLEFPRALTALAELVSLSAWACSYLARQPMLLDELIDPNQQAEPDWAALAGALRADLATADDNTERQMDLLRHFKHGQTFRLLVLDLAGALSLERLSDHLSDLAAVVLDNVLTTTWRHLRTRHRDQPCFAIIGYGKLGGRELGYESDLDIIFLHDDDAADASENYARLAQRINTWLTSLTPAGVLYETDLRLRPDGASGLLVSRVDAFAEYQHRNAWVWEHQALTRARFMVGDAAIGARFEALRRDILCLERDPMTLRREVDAMRTRMRVEHPSRPDSFDLKLDPGGIVDVEFAVQFLVLAHAHRHPALIENRGNIMLLAQAEALGLLAPGVGSGAADAYRDYRRLQHKLRLGGEREPRVGAGELQVQRAAVERLWTAVMTP